MGKRKASSLRGPEQAAGAHGAVAGSRGAAAGLHGAAAGRRNSAAGLHDAASGRRGATAGSHAAAVVPSRRPTLAAATRHSLPPLPRTFYLRPTLTVARELPGKFLVRRSGRTFLAVRIVEVEAYLGARDPASHAFRGRTNRNDVMFREGGHMYVYFTYGMHFCCNVVTEEEGKGMAVLIRAGEPVTGIRQMVRRRGTSEPTLLCSGPARLCQALGIGRKENGIDLCGDRIWIAGQRDAAEAGKPHGGKRKSQPSGTGGSGGAKGPDALRGGPHGGVLRLGRSTRVGIRKGTSHRWRFYVKGNPHVSKGRPSGPDGGKSPR